MVVTERLTPFSAMSFEWTPERAGNWLFHCHFQEHVVPHGALGHIMPNGQFVRIGYRDPLAASHDPDHMVSGMGGMVMGIVVHPRAPTASGEAAPRRRMRLVAIQDPEFPDTTPSMRFVVQDVTGGLVAEAGAGMSPPIYLTRGEPVSIVVINRLTEATAVHWHGIQLESYFDGVPGFSGIADRLAPAIAPGDSFEVRFTPPRSGTFAYHSHMDEPRQHRAGLVGALIVHDDTASAANEDIILVVKSRRESPGGMELNGSGTPDTMQLVPGRRYRLRLIAMQRGFPGPIVSITARSDSVFATTPDSMLVGWRLLPKDGANAPAAAAQLKPARQTISMGETYDFEVTFDRVGIYRVEVRTPTNLLVRVPFILVVTHARRSRLRLPSWLARILVS